MPTLDELLQSRDRKRSQNRGGIAPVNGQQRTNEPLPGDTLKQIIHARFGIAPCGSCHETARKMNENGVDWCREHVDELAEELHQNAKKQTWTRLLDFAVTSVAGNSVYRALIAEACDKCDPPAVDVVIVLNKSVDSSWLHSRGDIPVNHVKSIGLSAAWVQGEQEASRMIAKGAKLVINRAFALSINTIRRLSAQHPDVKFVTCCHSSQSYLMINSGSSLTKQIEFIDLARIRDNCYYGVVDERNYPGAIHDKCIYIPNVVDIFEPPQRTQNEIPVVSLAGRADMVKNFPQQIIALSMVAAERPIRVAMSIKGNAGPLLNMASQFGLEIQPTWYNWHDWIKSLGAVDVGLQCSFSESFNYVALEMLLAGVPVVGSSATRYIPDDWKADAEQPESMAWLLNRMLDDLPSAETCRKYGVAKANECNRDFNAAIEALI